MTSKPSELSNIIEAAILVSDEPVSVTRLLSLFPEDARPEKSEIIEAVNELAQACEPRGIELRKVGNGYRFQSKERYASWLRKLYEQRPPRYSRAVMETLSIIAYKQPVTRGDIEDVRGVSVSTDIMRTLVNRGWIKEVGFKDVPGRPALFATTREFLAYFNLKTIRELPVLQEKRDLMDVASDNQIQLPLEPPELTATDEPQDQSAGNDPSVQQKDETINVENNTENEETADIVTMAEPEKAAI